MGEGWRVDARGGGGRLLPRSSAQVAAPPSPSGSLRRLRSSRSLPPSAAPQAAHPVGDPVGDQVGDQGDQGDQVGDQADQHWTSAGTPGQVSPTQRRFPFRTGRRASVCLVWEAKRASAGAEELQVGCAQLGQAGPHDVLRPVRFLSENGSTVTGTPALAAARCVCKDGIFGSPKLDTRTLTTVSRSDATTVWRPLWRTLSSYISIVGGGGESCSGGGCCSCRSGGAACDCRVKTL